MVALGLEVFESIQLGGDGVNGRLVVKDAQNRDIVKLSTETPMIRAGGGGTVGTLRLADAQNFPTIQMIASPGVTGQGAIIHVGGGGTEGGLRIVDAQDRAVINLRGGTGVTQTRILVITGGSDVAEPFEITGAESIEPGMVVSIDPEHPGQLRVPAKAYDRTVAGIVSGANGLNPGLTLKQKGSTADGTFPVALTGRVYCWADASNGSIQPGDLLTTSNIPGHAMKVTDYPKAQGAIIGKAMASLKTGRGLVLVLVTLQ